jgi:hypothetical protein
MGTEEIFHRGKGGAWAPSEEMVLFLSLSPPPPQQKQLSITNTLIKTTVRNKYLFVLDFIVHYYNMFRRTVVLIKVLVDTRATGCITQQLKLSVTCTRTCIAKLCTCSLFGKKSQ